jgi:lysophospholipase L1-like esterase
MTVQLKRNDTKDTISYTVTNLDGSVVNLTGASIKFVMGKNKTLITNATATIVSAAAGTVSYTLTESDTLVAGTFNAEFEVTFSDGKVKTYPSNGYIQVKIEANMDTDQSTYIEDNIAYRVSDIQILKNSIQAQLDQFAVGASNEETAQARVEEDGITNTTLKARLDKKEAKFTQDIATLSTSVASKASKGDIAVTDINKNKGKFDQTYMTDEFLQQMAGTTPVNSVPALDSLTSTHLTKKSVSIRNISNELVSVFNGNKFTKTINTTASSIDMDIVFELGIDVTGKLIKFGFEGYINDANVYGVKPEIYLSDASNSLTNFILFNSFTQKNVKHEEYFSYSGEFTASATRPFIHIFPYPLVTDKLLKSSVHLKGFYLIVDGVTYTTTRSMRWGKSGDGVIEPVTNLPMRLVKHEELNEYAKKTELPILEEYVKKTEIQSSLSKWNNKNVVAFGDSIIWQDGNVYGSGDEAGTVARGYLTLMDEEKEFAAHTNYGVSGANIANNGVTSSVLTVVQGTNLTGVDLVLIGAGTNDLKNGIPIGTIGSVDDTNDVSTFYGAYKEILKTIMYNYPTVSIVLLTPLHRNAQTFSSETVNASGHKLIDYVDAIHKLGQMFSVPVCDLHRNAGISKMNISNYLYDKLHPNNLGYQRITRVLSSFVENI